MHNRTHFFLLIIFPIIFQIFQTPTLAFDEDKFRLFTYTVHIINGLNNNDNPLIIHCYSNDDDLGEHALWMKNEFKFLFGEHMFKFTHFWCVMRLGLKKKTIDVFRTGYESVYCHYTGNCFWSTREDGFYFSNDNESWLKRYEWY
ncbi:hypothetical protein Pint_26185 [Pistacia integerrima]|uniref:Uncharacterized protein n=1 Tax=Pistacia integerrima TaxID=434235 RepID=A0ACC0YCC7_9ROSI|nr:hypothetical protein Pint_26185 [Pistacia integerrima]